MASEIPHIQFRPVARPVDTVAVDTTFQRLNGPVAPVKPLAPTQAPLPPNPRTGSPAMKLMTALSGFSKSVSEFLGSWEDETNKKEKTDGEFSAMSSSATQIRDHLRDHCQNIVARYLRGHPANRHLITACSEILKVCKAAEPEEIALVVAGLHLMRRHDPRSFASDAGFWGQMVRQVRSLHGIAMGRTVTLATGKDRGWYKTLSLQATAMVAAMLLEAYSRFSAHVLASEEKEAERRSKPKEDLDRGFAATVFP